MFQVNNNYKTSFGIFNTNFENRPQPIECCLWTGKCLLRKKLITVLEEKYLIRIPSNIYQFKVNNRNTRYGCQIFSKLTIKTPEHH